MITLFLIQMCVLYRMLWCKDVGFLENFCFICLATVLLLPTMQKMLFLCLQHQSRGGKDLIPWLGLFKVLVDHKFSESLRDKVIYII